MSPRSQGRRPRRTEDHPPRTANRFNRREVARAYRAVAETGAAVERVDIDPNSGRISVVIAKPGGKVADSEVENWLSKQKGQHANQR